MVALEDIKELEKAFQQSMNEADASDKKRRGIPALTVEQKTKMQAVLARLNELPKHFPEKLTPESLRFFNDLGMVLAECAAEADALRLRFEGNRNAESVAQEFQLSRREDLATMIHYLDKVSQQVADLVARYEDDLAKQADHRKREQDTLDRLNKVLDQYS